MPTLFIGTYTERTAYTDGRAEGVLSAAYGGAAEIDAVRHAAIARNPSWLCSTADGRFVYAVAETSEFDGVAGGGVVAFAHRGGGTLVELDRASAGGDDPAHLALDPTERFLVVTTFGSGSVTIIPRRADGGLGPPTAHVRHQGAAAHAHQAVFDPTTGLVLVPDLGLDAVLFYQLRDDGGLHERPELRLRARSGAGPRHLAFHPDGRHLFLVNELDSTVTAYRRAGAGFVEMSVTSTVPEGVEHANLAAAVRVTPSGGSVLVSNRGHDSVAILRFDASSGRLVLTAAPASGGKCPRDIVLSPDGTHLLVAHQESDTIVVLAFDESAAALRRVQTLEAASPVCLLVM